MLKKVSRILLILVFLGGSGISLSAEQPVPLGLLGNHLNLVYSVSDGGATEQFYGEILGLERLPDIDLPGERYMIRFLGGESELKFIVGGPDRPQLAGGINNARGIRLLALLLPEERRTSIVERMRQAGIAVPEFTDGNMGSNSVSSVVIEDYDGNNVEIIFLADGLPDPVFDQVQIGLGVSDMAAMGEFLQHVLAFEPDETEGSMHRYAMGKTQIKFWQVPASKPAWVGRPHEKLGITMVQFVVSDVAAARDIIVARGGKIHTEPYVLGNIAVVMFVEGPDGILFEFGASLVD